jgi:hypothetical protein
MGNGEIIHATHNLAAVCLLDVILFDQMYEVPVRPIIVCPPVSAASQYHLPVFFLNAQSLSLSTLDHLATQMYDYRSYRHLVKRKRCQMVGGGHV